MIQTMSVEVKKTIDIEMYYVIRGIKIFSGKKKVIIEKTCSEEPSPTEIGTFLEEHKVAVDFVSVEKNYRRLEVPFGY